MTSSSRFSIRLSRGKTNPILESKNTLHWSKVEKSNRNERSWKVKSCNLAPSKILIGNCLWVGQRSNERTKKKKGKREWTTAITSQHLRSFSECELSINLMWGDHLPLPLPWKIHSLPLIDQGLSLRPYDDWSTRVLTCIFSLLDCRNTNQIRKAAYLEGSNLSKGRTPLSTAFTIFLKAAWFMISLALSISLKDLPCTILFVLLEMKALLRQSARYWEILP